MAALRQLADTTNGLFRTRCRFLCIKPVRIQDPETATHLLRIAQEAVSNAIKHGRATQILISLRRRGQRVTLMIRDNGRGIPKTLPSPRGIGLAIMRCRASIIGGLVRVERSRPRGTLVTCIARADAQASRRSRTRRRTAPATNMTTHART